jgi:hypothetical protein
MPAEEIYSCVEAGMHYITLIGTVGGEQRVYRLNRKADSVLHGNYVEFSYIADECTDIIVIQQSGRISRAQGDASCVPDVYIGSEPPTNGEAIWINPDEEPEGGGGAVSPEAIKQAVDEYMAENPIKETDPTVPAWAKQPQKPKYTAAEVGALPVDTVIPSGGSCTCKEVVLQDITLTETVSTIQLELEQDLYKHYSVLFYPMMSTEFESTNHTVTCYQYFKSGVNRSATQNVNFGSLRVGGAFFHFYADQESLMLADPKCGTSGYYFYQCPDEEVLRNDYATHFRIFSSLANCLTAGTRVVLKGWNKK